MWEAPDKLMSATSKIPVTKRGMVSVVYSLFDALGFLVPFIMKAKLLLQVLSRKGVGGTNQLKCLNVSSRRDRQMTSRG